VPPANAHANQAHTERTRFLAFDKKNAFFCYVSRTYEDEKYSWFAISSQKIANAIAQPPLPALTLATNSTTARYVE